ncbi:MAG TPA: MarR family transcriptional regulator [Pinirhizobacter sp.]|uniref:MarR family winged helix-turn-helix transcriptional regulator n=1 Tax=Pinirhizobacter sp. TaxID=2950432 RepID=UPI002C8D6AA4|nr:MarR family transcriptional regulator [Pinirhizobacter sp.]HMH67387.1 MarR family transcriptional regulator [Pinirhizobacter sp.]
MRSLDNHLCFALYAASRAMTAAYRGPLSELGLTYPQFVAMVVLWEADGVTVSELGERLQLDSGTLTPLLKRLEQANLVRRQRNADDERELIVTLTDDGHALQRKANDISEQVFCRTGLEEGTAVQLLGDLHDLAARLRDNTSV